MKRQIAHRHPNFSSCTNWLSKGPEELLRCCVLAASLATVPWSYQHESTGWGGKKNKAFLDKRAGAYRNRPQLQDSNKRAAMGWMQNWPESCAKKLVINAPPSN